MTGPWTESVLYAFQGLPNDGSIPSEPHAQGPGYFYGTIRLELAEDPQTILADEMNGQSLPMIPLRKVVKVENSL